ncbi:hypothetical protein BDQ94DRAFT_132468 [Aspergillus welwitschiae]|uniref:Uncharacterized protein n=1 Tax=Aspergillus welwitschiae TaxID=1341132 RepID=A0A3F3QJ79_9EURO|nr:hypothetical protein BDQ94DRAFT_132468 [Aspergillus welwitschiae]RDH39140.1 hypothetical protein BDQ94DRAFT_132468 [Aspergillus welwitschiae]
MVGCQMDSRWMPLLLRPQWEIPGKFSRSSCCPTPTGDWASPLRLFASPFFFLGSAGLINMRIIGAYLMGCGLMVVLGGRLNQKQRVGL